ncbi:MAG: hypothetical protein EXS50_00700 [Candidatus Taylorbacteria bacterium]|nr:hypothetical protein [Candidatus Taylorbacteria bacterium]
MNNISQKIIITIIPCIIGVFLLYGFLVRQTILNVVAREEVGRSVSSVLSSTSSLETQYIALKDGINIDLAYEKGFMDTDSPTFITRTTLSRASLAIRIQ